MSSPDYEQFVDLSLYDKDAADILAAAKVTLQARIPEWVPADTNMEVMVMEAVALEVSETIFSVNRLPKTMLRALLALYEVEQNPGTPPTVELTFTAYDTDGYVIPAGTEVTLIMDNGEYLSFFTDAEATIVATTTTIAVDATATDYTDAANGIASGTEVVLVNSVIGIESVETSSIVTGGTLPETTDAWTERGTQRLQRLVDTLVVPSHFTAAALENALVYRANTINNWDGEGQESTYTWAGNVVTITYTNHGFVGGEDITLEFTSGDGTPDGAYTVASVTNDDVYTVALTGSGTGGNVTVWRLVGENPGHVTVVVYGVGGVALSAPEKAALDTELSDQANANLAVHVIDPTITTQAVTAVIAIESGYVEADVITAVEDRLTEYLSTDNWAWAGTIRRNELISVIDQVAGVDYVDDLTVPAADVPLTDGTSLATAGTLTITAV